MGGQEDDDRPCTEVVLGSGVWEAGIPVSLFYEPLPAALPPQQYPTSRSWALVVTMLLAADRLCPL